MCVALLGLLGTAGAQASSFTIRADWFDRGNVQVSKLGQSYATRYPCIWNGGKTPNQSEYDLEFPVAGQYTLVALYTAASPRPMDIYIDGQRVHRGFSSVTGDWRTASAQWERQCTVALAAGRHTVRLQCPGACMPHICALRFESNAAFPDAWRLTRKVAQPETPPDPPILPAVQRVLDLAALGGQMPEITVALQGGLPAGPAERDELTRSLPLPDSERTAWQARFSVRLQDGRKETADWGLVPDRLRTMLDATVELVRVFRALPGVKPDFLAAERQEASRRLDECKTLAAQPDAQAKWQRFCEAYVEAYRLRDRVALANPLLNFERLLVVRRSMKSPRLGLPQNWQSNCVLPRKGFDDEIATLAPLRSAGGLKTVYRPAGPYFVGDVDLSHDGRRMLFSSIGTNNCWQIFEIGVDGQGLRQVTPGDQPDVDNYDACYLPDGRVMVCSTAFMAAVPCVNGSTRVANLYRMNADGSGMRQLCFDQEHNWCPTMLPNGRLLYLRWEYTDTPHAHDRVLFTMNPDGTNQMEYYGSNSYWPNSLFYARPIPGHATQFVGIVSGHHGVPRMGELVVFDPARGRREAEGVVQRIPGRGRRVEARIEDQLVDASWPKFLHPYPLSDKFFLVAAQPSPQAAWGIYLVDTMDNMTLVREEPGYALLEPVPLRPTPTPPVIPDRVEPQRRDAVVLMADVYAGIGLKDIPRGAVKSLRVFSYHFLYPKMGGPQGVVGMEGPWDIKRILGTVPVERDGSALFRVPANMPISVQPLDAEGKALQLMRSWFTGMPGEVVSCVGCHENPNSTPIPSGTLASRRRPSEIAPWRGPMRGFNFAREVQPVLDRFCVGCHDGREQQGQTLVDLRGKDYLQDYTSKFHFGGKDAGHFTTSYAELHRYVRRPGLESDYHTLTPMDFHADTTELVQMLAKGHHGVRLDAEAWDRLITWIDLNAPFHGTWTEIAGRERVEPWAQRRRELLKLYAGIDDDPEAIPALPVPFASQGPAPSLPSPLADRPSSSLPSPLVGEGPGVRGSSSPGWPFDAQEAQRRQQALGMAAETVDLGDGLSLQLVPIPAGQFVMGSRDGAADERPASVVRIEKPFWLGRFEVTNEQYARYDPAHDSRVEHKLAMQFGVQGFPLNEPRQPVVRVSWHDAMLFCAWLSRRTGRRFTLPTEAQWEWACRAGSARPFFYGDTAADFGPYANLADRTLREYVCHPYHKDRLPFPNPGKYDDWIPKSDAFTDGGFLSEAAVSYRPNPWGLMNMHGNVWEWTASCYAPYPYDAADGRNTPTAEGKRVVRGGSWRDRPQRATASFRLAYPAYQHVFNVGFRVVCE
jgi:formylglycine-generating enzyme required for sulfatase activity